MTMRFLSVEKLKPVAFSPYYRIGLMAILAFAAYGGWAFYINLSYSLSTALIAGLTQGMTSSLSTSFISGIIEYCYSHFKQYRTGLMLTWLTPPTLTSLFHALLQWVVDTPEIIYTVLPSVIMGYVFSGIYVRGLVGLNRFSGAS